MSNTSVYDTARRIVTIWRGNGLFGFRGVSHNSRRRPYARIVSGTDWPKIALLVFDIPVEGLGQLPDMSEGSEFDRRGSWYHYPEEKKGYEIHTSGYRGPIQRVVLAGRVVYDSSVHGPITN